jgi:predicted short-subunit dehydrogenase-like oxidoreductase (DUF2520 family)
MKIVIIGSGNLATQLSLALKEAGKDIIQVYSRTEEHARTLAEKIGCGFTTSVDDVNRKADLYIVSIKDDAIRAMAAKLGGVGMIIHTAGSIPMNVFSGHADHYGVLYPMQTFSKERLVDFSRVPFFLEASDAQTMACAHAIAGAVSNNVSELPSDKRRQLHLAAVFACNFANHCYELSAEILERHGIPFDVMLPLIDETAAKVHHLSPKEAQTGPAVRYDENVIRAHTTLLKDQPTVQQIYQTMSHSIHQTALPNEELVFHQTAISDND